MHGRGVHGLGTPLSLIQVNLSQKFRPWGTEPGAGIRQYKIINAGIVESYLVAPGLTGKALDSSRYGDGIGL